MNGVPPALRAVKDGGLALTVELNPLTWGRIGVDKLSDHFKGEKLEKQVFIPHVLIDRANVDAKMPNN